MNIFFFEMEVGPHPDYEKIHIYTRLIARKSAYFQFSSGCFNRGKLASLPNKGLIPFTDYNCFLASSLGKKSSSTPNLVT
jgi:hypothetical protein